MEINKEDIEMVKDYMYQNHCGYSHPSSRKEISKNLGLEDRYFRSICSQIPEIITSCHHGYYILPLADYDGFETKSALKILNGDNRRKIIAAYLRMRKQKNAVNNIKTKQLELVG